MKRLCAGLLSLIGLCAAQGAAAESWHYVGRTGTLPERTLFFLDKDSITVSASGQKSARIAQILEVPLAGGLTGMAATQNIDCTAKIQSTLTTEGYRLDGTIAPWTGATEPSSELPLFLAAPLCGDDWNNAVAIGNRTVVVAAGLMLGRK